MILPLQITFRNMKHSDAVDSHIREEAAKLDEFFDRITSCRVVVELPHQHHNRGNSFNIRIALDVPGREIVVNHQPNLHGKVVDFGEEKHLKGMELEGPHKDIYVAIHDAFRTVRRQLQDYARRYHHQTKIHAEIPEARVARIFPQQGFGFLETSDGREIYFHRNSVQQGAFETLNVGATVHYSEERGEQGPQASYVRVGA